MPALASELRKTLENTVVDARDKAERGARDALTALAVAASEPYASMSEEERKLRNRLRARGRQLGDQRDPQKGTQSIERLVREMAYEHWHRMLFARFLAENQLLIEPSSRVAISLEECEELAVEEGTDLWGLAAQYAQEMLPQIFRTDNPVLALRLPLEIRQQLQALVAGLNAEVFTASDSLGWTYQFWQTKRKKEVNDSGVKIGADELSPVTQLFTEDYMVDFLLDNTLGAWHAGKLLAANPELARTAQSEDDLRQAVALPGCSWSYLRFVKSDDGTWAPAAGTFEGWPRTAAELKCLDPCMGSGHFIVAMFERLVALRIAEEGLNEKAAVAAVIEENLFGLEIDPRCTQIAAFNLALAAWRRVGYCKLPPVNLACSGLAPNTKEADWLALAGDNERLRNGMERIYRLFQRASVLGSLINPRSAASDLLVASFHELQPLLEHALEQDSSNEAAYEIAVTARGVAKAAEILSDQFTLVATNVPYLGRGKQDDALKDFGDRIHPEAKADLATCFVERSLVFCTSGGSTALVTPQSWLFQSDYIDIRKTQLANSSWNAVARLGEKGFESSQAAGAFTTLLEITRKKPTAGHELMFIDVAEERSPNSKAMKLLSKKANRVLQQSQLQNPDSRLTGNSIASESQLGQFADVTEGLSTGDSDRFTRSFWEMPKIESDWSPLQGAPSGGFAGNGRSTLVLWEEGGRTLKDFKGARVRGHKAWGRVGILVGRIRNLRCDAYDTRLFEKSCVAITPHKEENLSAIRAFTESAQFQDDVKKLDQNLRASGKAFSSISFDLDYWNKVAAEKYQHELPTPTSRDATQWLFNGNPADADQPLHVAVARLVGYLWPRQAGFSFPDSPALNPDGLEASADEDGIVCLSPLRGEEAAASRLRKLLSTAFGNEWSHAKERELLLETAVANDAKKATSNLEEWLRQSFFSEHCKLFKSRPFIWQIWDGNPQGFSALVNYHKLATPKGQGKKTLELLTYTYLGDWINRQKLDQAEGIDGADDRLVAALDLQEQLKKIIEGEPPYDIFVRWKPLHKQAIGWDPDINDGVRLNIRPFLNAQLIRGGRKGAGVLSWKPFQIKQKADQGKEPMRTKDDFPWFWGWDETNTSPATDFGAPISGTPSAGDSFDGNRWNDLHYTRAAKEAARVRHQGEG